MNATFESTEQLLKAVQGLTNDIFELDDLMLIMNLSEAGTMIPELLT